MKTGWTRILALLVATMLLTAAFGGVAAADDTLRPGDQGSAVEELQRLLKKANCYNFEEITGYYGSVTEAGVRKFQSTHGLAVDGVAGADTMEKLRSGRSTDKPLKSTSVCYGMEGTDVKEIQERLIELGLLDEDATGYFGPKTESAVMAFQDAAGVKADGVVGDKTRELLFSGFKSDSLIPGMKGSDVEKLQKRLKELGYYSGPITGLYGQLTGKAVEYFQKLNGLASDGVAGKKTRTAVYDPKAKTEKEARRAPATANDSKYKDLPGQSAAGQEKAADIVAYAKKFLGCPYVSGAAGPKSFECSGLTYYVYKNFGITLPRKAYGQGYTDYGVKITDRNKLMPGDLVFFNSIRSDNDVCDHVGIYIGDGKMVHSPAPGMKVMISYMLNARDFSWARRVLK